MLFLVSCAYFLLLNSVLYSFTAYLVAVSRGQAGRDGGEERKSLPPITDMVFDSWSVQYQCLSLAVPVLLLLQQRDLALLIRLGQFGAVAVLAYVAFIVYLFARAIAQAETRERLASGQDLFSADLSSVAGTFALSFLVHNTVCQILAQSGKPTQARRHLLLGYLSAYAVYGIIGVLGAIGIQRYVRSEVSYQTICEFFIGSADPAVTIPAQIVNLLFFLQLLSVLPVLCHVSRTQLLEVRYGSGHVPSTSQNLCFNAVFLAVALSLQIFSTNPSIVIGISGAVTGFLICYLLPFAVRRASLRKSENESTQA